MTLQHAYFAACRDVPQADGFVVRPRHDVAAAWRHAHRHDYASSPRQFPHFAARRHVPQSNALVSGARHDVAAIRRHRHCRHNASAARQLANFAARRDVPHANGVVIRPRHDVAAIRRHAHRSHPFIVPLQPAHSAEFTTREKCATDSRVGKFTVVELTAAENCTRKIAQLKIGVPQVALCDAAV